MTPNYIVYSIYRRATGLWNMEGQAQEEGRWSFAQFRSPLESDRQGVHAWYQEYHADVWFVRRGNACHTRSARPIGKPNSGPIPSRNPFLTAAQPQHVRAHVDTSIGPSRTANPTNPPSLLLLPSPSVPTCPIHYAVNHRPHSDWEGLEGSVAAGTGEMP
jgi:hypothetical protein